MLSPSTLMTNDPQKGHGLGHVSHFKFWGPQRYHWNGLCCNSLCVLE